MSEKTILGPCGEELSARLAAMTADELEDMRRTLMGEDENDLIRRGDLNNIIRGLRRGPVEYQRALSDVSKAVTQLRRLGIARRPGVYGATLPGNQEQGA